MVRAAAKNHAHVGVVTNPDQYDGGAVDELARVGRAVPTRRATRWRAPPSRTPPPTTPRSSRGSTRRRRGRGARVRLDVALPPTLHLTLERAEVAALRREPPPARRALPRRGHDAVVGRRGPARRDRPVVPQPLRRRRGVAARARAGRRRSRASPPWRSSSTPTPAAPRSAPTLGEAFAARPGRGPAQRLRRRRRGRGAGRRRAGRAMAEGPQADVVVAESFDAEAVEILVGAAQGDAAAERPRARAPRAARCARCGDTALGPERRRARGPGERVALRHRGHADRPTSCATCSSRGGCARARRPTPSSWRATAWPSAWAPGSSRASSRRGIAMTKAGDLARGRGGGVRRLLPLRRRTRRRSSTPG